MTKLIIGTKGSGKTKKLISLVLDAAEKTAAANGKLVYCSAFYDAEGNLL